ncbi:MAG: hypothetical protein KDC38_02755 [Planctomycetes bacterium]|nr:hypothetical protein [Planctomycetota bacterium]
MHPFVFELYLLYLPYLFAASVVVAPTIGCLVWIGKPRLLRVEYGAWLFPGLVHMLLLEVLPERGKSLANVAIEPYLLVGIVEVVFVVRVIAAARHPDQSRRFAWWGIAAQPWPLSWWCY